LPDLIAVKLLLNGFRMAFNWPMLQVKIYKLKIIKRCVTWYWRQR